MAKFELMDNNIILAIAKFELSDGINIISDCFIWTMK